MRREIPIIVKWTLSDEAFQDILETLLIPLMVEEYIRTHYKPQLESSNANQDSILPDKPRTNKGQKKS